jgi:hypothetical protein
MVKTEMYNKQASTCSKTTSRIGAIFGNAAGNTEHI